MAKSDLLKEAIADAKAVKETALANAKIALEEAFAPRIQSMLSTKLAEDLYDEDEDIEVAPEPEMDLGAELEAPVAAPIDVAPAPEMDLEAPAPEMDLEAPAPEMEPEVVAEPAMDLGVEEDLELEAIIRELEEDLNEDDLYEEPSIYEGTEEDAEAEADLADAPEEISEDFNIDEIIESILSEDDEVVNEEDEVKEEVDDSTEELQEAYDTIKSLRGTINEVNLLNAKLLYTNKLFRNFELSENQKMTVIENFDRAGTTREVKLVFSTLAESFQFPIKKRKIVKESFASKPSGTTAPSTKTKRIINEGNELANRWKKLAGLLD